MELEPVLKEAVSRFLLFFMRIQQGSSSRREHLLCITVARLESSIQDNPYKNPSKKNPTKEESGQSECGRERYDQNSVGCPEWTAFGIRSADGRSGVLNTIRIRIRSGFRILKTNL
ncbi:hypothetical protein ACLOJK_037780, partial [Asimina triloba]